jgi:hypothetical protein
VLERTRSWVAENSENPAPAALKGAENANQPNLLFLRYGDSS